MGAVLLAELVVVAVEEVLSKFLLVVIYTWMEEYQRMGEMLGVLEAAVVRGGA